jgi:hypothetical protein
MYPAGTSKSSLPMANPAMTPPIMNSFAAEYSPAYRARDGVAILAPIMTTRETSDRAKMALDIGIEDVILNILKSQSSLADSRCKTN